MSKILLIGPCKNKYDSKDTGGVTVLFELLISELTHQKVNFTIIDTLKANYGSNFKMFLKIIPMLIKNIRTHDHISLHATMNSFFILSPIIIIFAKIFAKTTSLRKFAGSFNDVYHSANFIKKNFIKFILKNTNYIFFETKYLVDEFKIYNLNTFWFPNVRDECIQITKTRSFNKRFVYIGSINEEKGIDELCEAISQLDSSYTCDLYGPIKFKNEKYSMEYFNKININYCGTLNSNEVIKTMDKYDVLILPSHREGYPGVIIEAFARGIPIIATKLQGIMEMCEDNKNSLLIDIKESQQLVRAIKSIDNQKYQYLQKGAIQAFSNFNNKEQTLLFLSSIGYFKT